MAVIDLKTGRAMTADEIAEMVDKVDTKDSKIGLVIDLMVQQFYRTDQEIAELKNTVNALNMKLATMNKQ